MYVKIWSSWAWRFTSRRWRWMTRWRHRYCVVSSDYFLFSFVNIELEFSSSIFIFSKFFLLLALFLYFTSTLVTFGLWPHFNFNLEMDHEINLKRDKCLKAVLRGPKSVGKSGFDVTIKLENGQRVGFIRSTRNKKWLHYKKKIKKGKAAQWRWKTHVTEFTDDHRVFLHLKKWETGLKHQVFSSKCCFFFQLNAWM